MHDYLLPNQARARHAQVALAVVMGIELLFAVMQVWTQPVLGDFLGQEEAVWSQNFYIMLYASLACILGYLICMVFFLLWWARANANLRRLGQGIYPNESYAVVCWFIPIGGWIEPWRLYQQLVARYTGLQHQFPQHRLANAPDAGALKGIGGIWWASFVLVGVIDAILLLRGKAIGVQLIPFFLPAWVNILPGIMTILMIRQFSRVEEGVARAVRSGDFAAHLDRIDEARAEQGLQPGDAVAGWLDASESGNSAADPRDPFSD
jgi:hypothetical protein